MSKEVFRQMVRLKLAYPKLKAYQQDMNLQEQRRIADLLTHEEAVYIVKKYEQLP